MNGWMYMVCAHIDVSRGRNDARSNVNIHIRVCVYISSYLGLLGQHGRAAVLGRLVLYNIYVYMCVLSVVRAETTRRTDTWHKPETDDQIHGGNVGIKYVP